MKRAVSVVAVLLLLVPALSSCTPANVVLYTDLRQEDASRLIEPFVQASGVKVDIVTFGSAESLVKAVAPGGGDRYAGGAEPSPTPNPNPPDVILTQDMLALTQLADGEALESYMSSSVSSLPPPYGANGGGWWYGFGGRAWVIAWNTDLVTKKPETFQDLADNAYPMKSVTIPNPQQFYFYPLAVYSVMGSDYAMNLFQTLMLNQANLAGSPDMAAQSVAEGKAQVAITTYALAKSLKDAGKPVDFILPDQGQTEMGAYVEFYSVAVAKGGKNLSGAKKLDDWLLSAEAEKRSVEVGLSDVTLRDVGGGAPVVKPLVVSPGDIIKNTRAASDAFNRMAGGN